MAADLGGSQISALLESVPGIRNVLRSPVADALVNTIRAAVGLRPFAPVDAEELVQYAVRRGLINQSEGDQVLEDVRSSGRGRKPAATKRTPTRKPAAKRSTKPATGKKAAPRAPKSARRPVKKR